MSQVSTNMIKLSTKYYFEKFIFLGVMEGDSKMKKYIFLENHLTDFDEKKYMLCRLIKLINKKNFKIVCQKGRQKKIFEFFNNFFRGDILEVPFEIFTKISLKCPL